MMFGTFIWLALILIAFGIFAVVGVTVVRGVISGGQRRQSASPENALRDRYARGEIGRQAYLDALTDILKDRYVRGELTAEEYEERLGILLEPGPTKPRRLPPVR